MTKVDVPGESGVAAGDGIRCAISQSAPETSTWQKAASVRPFPHHYVVTGTAVPGPGQITLQTSGAPTLATSLPAEFDGPGNRWSPESLLVAAIADCYLFTLRGIAAKSRLQWTWAFVEATGTLDRIDNVSRFTHAVLRVRLEVPADADLALARRVATRAEQMCLITRSLNTATRLELTVVQPELVTGLAGPLEHRL